ncbi:MAG: ankyrin repeat domain-containing protein, partial [Nevskiales bacterium]
VGLLTAAYGDSTSDTSRVLDVIRLLVKQGCDIDQYNASGLTPLHNAVLFRQPDLLRFLLEQQADPLLRIIAIPGKSPGRTLANLDAYGLALTLRVKFPDDVAVDEILKLLKPAA